MNIELVAICSYGLYYAILTIAAIYLVVSSLIQYHKEKNVRRYYKLDFMDYIEDGPPFLSACALHWVINTGVWLLIIGGCVIAYFIQ